MITVKVKMRSRPPELIKQTELFPLFPKTLNYSCEIRRTRRRRQQMLRLRMMKRFCRSTFPVHAGSPISSRRRWTFGRSHDGSFKRACTWRIWQKETEAAIGFRFSRIWLFAFRGIPYFNPLQRFIILRDQRNSKGFT